LHGLAQAQPSLPLEAALQRLPQTNRLLKAGELHRQYLASLQRTAGELPFFRANAELGQTNSRNFDSRLSVAQGFLPFGFVKGQRALLQSQFISFDNELQLRQLELRLLIRQVFLGYEYEAKRQLHFLQLDTLYQRLIILAEQRLKAGETNRLELAGFQQQRQLLQQAIAGSKINQQQWQVQLKLLLQTDTSFVPTGAWQTNSMAPPMVDTALLAQHPAVKWREAMLASASAETALENARRQPAFEIGYNNQSLVGFQTDRGGNDKWYNAGNRFSTGQVGVNFPLIGKATKARVAAAKEKEKQMAYEVSAEKQQVSAAWRGKLEQTMLQRQQLKRYEEELLPGSNAIIETARQQLLRGELNYVTWLLIAEPAFQTRLAYIDEQLNYQLLLAQTLYYSEQ
nr:TolC family protein [Chitinophagaceae bacterium]